MVLELGDGYLKNIQLSPIITSYQYRLSMIGYNTNGIDGKFGSNTQKAFNSFCMRYFGHTSDKFEQNVLDKIDEIYSSLNSGDASNSGDGKNPDWTYLWDTLKLDKDRESIIKKTCAKIVENKHIYAEVSDMFGNNIPYWFIASLHYRESSLNFKGVLHNGEKIIGTGKKTTLVPKGKGPFETWAEAAYDALLEYKKYNNWDIYTCLKRSELFNGTGYRHRIGDSGVIEYSPYVFAGTNQHDETGKYVADGSFSTTAREDQLGVAALYKGLQLFFNEVIV